MQMYREKKDSSGPGALLTLQYDKLVDRYL